MANAFLSSHLSDLQLYSFIGKTLPWEETYNISNISQTSPAVVTSYFHGLENGDIVTITGVQGMSEINNAVVPYIVENKTQHTFELRAIDATGWTAYASGGVIHKALENDWPAPDGDLETILKTQSNIIGAKKLFVSDMSTVVPRIDWEVNKTFDFWNPYDVNLQLKKFYVMTDEFRVYKCLWNNGGALSTVKPTSTALTPFQTTDGYTWKYMFTVPQSMQDKFLSVNWIPVKTLDSDDGSDQWDVQNSAVRGTIDSIIVNVQGEGYSFGATSVVIEGNGNNAAASIPPDGIDSQGRITKIKIDNPGQDYSYATIIINGDGTGAKASPVIAHGRGHGSDPARELMAFYVKIAIEFASNENENFMVENDFRQIGLIESPLEISGQKATKNVYDCRTKMILSNIQGSFSMDDVVEGSQSKATATIVNIDGSTVWLSDVSGTFVAGEAIVSSNGAQGAIDSIDKPDFDIYSGSMLYIANFGRVTRTNTQTEAFDVIIEF
jgi:hypothetical protein